MLHRLASLRKKKDKQDEGSMVQEAVWLILRCRWPVNCARGFC
jgi:hypothetical protein